MAARIVAAFDPYVEDRAPVTLALAAGELTGAPVIAAERARDQARRSEIKSALQLAIAALAPGVEIEYDIFVDDPAGALLRVSAHVNLLVCGSRGYGPLRTVLLGGVSRRLVDGARCPVLVLPRDARRPLEDLLDGADTVAAR